MNYEKIMPISYSDITFTEKYNDYNELTVSIPEKTTVSYYDNGAIKHKTVTNPVWESIIAGSVILMTIYNGSTSVHKEYFSVTDFSVTSDSTEKEVTATSAHQILFNHLILSGYNDTRKLYQIPTESYIANGYDTSDNTNGGILNYIIEYKLNNPKYLTSSDFWKVTYYDENLNYIFEGNTLSKSELEELRDKVAQYWQLSHNYTAADGGYSKYEYENGLTPTDSSFTLKDWSQEANYWYSNKELIDLYAVRNDMQELVNNIMYTVQNAYEVFTLTSRFNILLTDTYYGTKALTYAETAVSYMQSFLDTLINENNIADGKDRYITFVEKTMSMFTDLTTNLFTPLLVFKGISGIPPYRTLSFDGTNLTDVFAQLAESYMCVFVFDNVNKEIKIYSRQNPDLGEDSSLIISPDNFIADIQKQDSTEQVITRLYLTGKDSATIAGISHNGMRYTDNFDYFKSTAYMSQNLIDALDKYETAINSWTNTATNKSLQETLIDYDQQYESKIGDFMYLYDYFVKYINVIKELNDNETRQMSSETSDDLKEELTTEHSALMDMENGYITVLDGTLDYEEKHYAGIDYSDKATMDFYESVDGEYTEKMKKFFSNCYAVLQKKIDLQESFQYENVVDSNGNLIFTDKLLAELECFIFESEMTVDTISSSQALLYYAKNYMKYINKIPVTIEVSLIDILDNKKYQSLWNRINSVGDYIMVTYEPFGLTKEYCRLISYTHKPISAELTLQFSNADEIQDSYNSFLNGVVKTALDLSKSSQKYQDSWDEYLQKKEYYLQEGQDIDASINSIMAGGKKVIGSGGLVLSKQPGNTMKQLADGVYCAGGNGSDSGNVNSDIYNSDTALAADLVVNSVRTDFKRAYKYLTNDKTNLNYEYLHDEQFLFISDVFESETPIQLVGANGSAMYWTEDPTSWTGGYTLENIRKQMTANITDYPVYVYQYTSYVKGYWSFIEEPYEQPNEDGTTTVIENAIPVLSLGVGDNNGNGTGTIKKDTEGLQIAYTSQGDAESGVTSGTEFLIKLKDSGIYQTVGGVDYRMYPVLVDTELEIDLDNPPKDVFIFVPQITE